MKRFAAASVVFLASFGIVIACGGDDPSAETPVGPVPSSPDGGEGGAPLDLSTQRGACVGYIEAYAARAVACGIEIGERTRKDIVAACPEYVFSPGSKATVEGLNACLAVLANVSCADFVAEKLPAGCLAPGERAGGQSCLYSRQCASLACTRPRPDTCGTCKTPSTNGQCGGELACPLGQTCKAGLCEPSTLPPPRGKVGDACQAGPDCAADLLCAAASSDAGATGTCRAYPKEGEPCVFLRNGSVEPRCFGDGSLYCRFASAQDAIGSCARGVGSGEVCRTQPSPYGEQPGPSCSAAFRCVGDAATKVGTCQPGTALGDACPQQGDILGVKNQCADPLASCVVQDRSTTGNAQYYCMRQASRGEACGPGAICPSTLGCVSGTCQPLTSCGGP